MRKKISLIITALSFALFSIFIFQPLALASCDKPANSQEAVQCGVNSASPSGTNPNDAPETLSQLAAKVINILSLLAGVAAVIMLIIGGFKYVTSSGSPEAAKSARNTITYAVIGLVIVAISQLIVHFVLHSIDNPTIK